MCYTNPMINHEQPPNWVAERAKCRIDVIFEALSQVVERDVAEFNKLPRDQRRGLTIEVVTNGEGTSPILQVYRRDEHGSQASVIFIQRPTAIEVQMTQGRQLLLHTNWNNDRRTCLLTTHDNDMTYKVWELSQATLGPLLFD